MKPAIALLTLGLLFVPAHSREEAPNGWLGSVSLVQLLVSPKQYAGEILAVTGYMDSPGGELYLTADHARAGDLSSAIHLAGADLIDKNGKPPCQNLFVWIKGRFAEVRPGYYLLTDIEHIYDPSTKSSCYRRTASSRSIKP